MSQLTQDQKDAIVALYKNGDTFRQAQEALPTVAELENNRGFYEGVAAVGQLTDDQARSVLQSACEPPGKAKCRHVISRIAAEQSVPTAEVEAVLREHFGLSPNN